MRLVLGHYEDSTLAGVLEQRANGIPVALALESVYFGCVNFFLQR